MPIHAIILAAGRGERMAPLTDVVPKANLPIVDTYLIDRLILSLKSAGVTDCTIGAGWKHELVASHLQSNPENAHVRIVNVPKWEVGPLMTLVGTLAHTKNETALVCPVDCVIEGRNVLSVIKAHESNTSNNYLATLAVDPASVSGTRVFADDAGHVVGIGHQPAGSEDVGCSAMLLVLEAGFRSFCKASLERGRTRVVDVLQQAISEGVTIGYSVVGAPWYDIDDIPSLLDTNVGLLSSSGVTRAGWMSVPATQSMSARDRVPTGSDIVLAPGCEIIGPSLVGPGSTIRRGSKIGPFALLGVGSEIGESCSITNAVLFGNSSLPSRSRINLVVVHDGLVYGRK